MAKYEDRVVDMSNMFRVQDMGVVDGENWYTVWADGDVLDWILDYDSTQWVNHNDRTVDMSEGMLTMLKLKYSDREIPNPYLGLIPTDNLFFSPSPEGKEHRVHTWTIQLAQDKLKR